MAMKATYIDYNETNSFSSTVLSYLSRDQELRDFLSYFPSIDGFKHFITEKRVVADRNILVSTLKDQYKELFEEDSTERSNYRFKQVELNIDLLSSENTYTVTTGHQLNIFTGPLYFLYKIVTAINLARDLKEAFPENNFVPVYWMATEDHDFAEINHTTVLGKPIVWEHETKGATGRISTASIVDAVRDYKKLLGISENSDRLCAIIEDAYLKHESLAQATRHMVNALFGEYGLVIVDADCKELKKQFGEIIVNDIVNKNSFRNINDTNSRLEKAGFATQVHAREVNFFYMKDDLRERIVDENGRYSVLNTSISFSEEELREEIRLHPERFSPNVVMRPLYQEIILPNIAYVGGGAEIVYWLQLKANFDFYKVDFPLLILRNSALITDSSFSSKLCRLRIPLKDIFKDTDSIKKEWVLNHSHHTMNLADERNEFHAIFERIKLRAYKIDPTLGPSTEAVRTRLQKALSNLEQKFIKAEKRNHEGALSQIESLRNKYFPHEGLQERSENFGIFYIKYGEALISELIRHFRPLDFKFTILEP